MKSFFRIPFILFFAVQCASIANKPLSGDVDLQGHRGARGLKPENTWPAFEAAYQNQMTTLELDTVLTKDREVVIHHDSESNPQLCVGKDGKEIVSKSLYDLTASELESYDCGSKKNPRFPEQVIVPGAKIETIGKFFQRVMEYERKNKLKPASFNIETKFPDDTNSKVSPEIMNLHVEKLLAEIVKYKMESRTTIQSFYLPALEVVRAKNQKVKTSALFAPTYFQGFLMTIGLGNWYRSAIFEKATELKVNITSPYFLYVTLKFVSYHHEKNIQVIPWTVNEEKEMLRLLDCGVDGIISDYPDRLRRVYEVWRNSKTKK